MSQAITAETTAANALHFASGLRRRKLSQGDVGDPSGCKKAHSSHSRPLGKMHTPYSPPLLSFLIWSFPPFFVQFTEAGLGSPAFLLGRSAGTLTREASQDLNHAGKTPSELHPQRPPD